MHFGIAAVDIVRAALLSSIAIAGGKCGNEMHRQGLAAMLKMNT
jgi:hypothetical protein